jgi:hypothetical protein
MSEKPVTDRKYRQARRRSARKNAMNKLARNVWKKVEGKKS